MTTVQKLGKKAVSLFLALALLAGVGSLLVTPASASVTIKTQPVANELLRRGAIRGIDVSMWQGDINWSRVAQDDVNFVFVRASYGTNSDPYFVANARGARTNGIRVGAYHYAHFRSTASMKAEADYFLSQLRKVDINYPVVLDVENHYGLTSGQLTTLCLQFIEILEKEGYSVMLYTYSNFFKDHLDTSRLGNTKLWVANYLEQPKGISHTVWQHTSHGRVSGISGYVDLNVAYSGNMRSASSTPRLQNLSGGGNQQDVSSPLPKYGQVSTSSSSSASSGAGDKGYGIQKVSVSAANSTPLTTATGQDKSMPLPKATTTTAKPAPEPRVLQVDSKLSAEAKAFLNSEYKAGISTTESVKMSDIDRAIALALQREAELSETGVLSPGCAQRLDEIDFTAEENIVKLFQIKLLYTGYSTGALNGVLTSEMQQSLAKYQEDHGLHETGQMDLPTMHSLFAIIAE